MSEMPQGGGPAALREALERLTGSELPDGARLPSERELATTYGVNRLTVRRAIDALVAQGLVIRRQGAGSFVRRQPATRALACACFTAETTARGGVAGNAQVSITLTRADARLATLLQVPPGAPVRTIMRLRTINRAPAGINQAWIADELVPDLTALGREDSLLDVLMRRYHLPITQVDEVVSASVLDRRAAQMLRTLAMMPALQVTRTMRDREGRALAQSDTLVRADRYTYRNTVH